MLQPRDISHLTGCCRVRNRMRTIMSLLDIDRTQLLDIDRTQLLDIDRTQLLDIDKTQLLDTDRTQLSKNNVLCYISRKRVTSLLSTKDSFHHSTNISTFSHLPTGLYTTTNFPLKLPSITVQTFQHSPIYQRVCIPLQTFH